MMDSMRVSLPILVAAFAASLLAQPADLVLRNGKIVTMNPAVPTAEALAVRAGKIAALDRKSTRLNSSH